MLPPSSQALDSLFCELSVVAVVEPSSECVDHPTPPVTRWFCEYDRSTVFDPFVSQFFAAELNGCVWQKILAAVESKVATHGLAEVGIWPTSRPVFENSAFIFVHDLNLSC